MHNVVVITATLGALTTNRAVAVSSASNWPRSQSAPTPPAAIVHGVGLAVSKLSVADTIVAPAGKLFFDPYGRRARLP